MSPCPGCGTETVDGQTHCPDCGSLLATQTEDRGARYRRTKDIAAGFIAGVGALVVGCVTTLTLSDAGDRRGAVEEIVESDGPAGAVLGEFLPEWYHVAGWLFFDSHQVDVSVRVGEALGGAAWVGEYAETLLPTASELQILPPLLLAGAGAIVALRRSRAGPADAALAGGTVVVGYLPGVVAVAAVATFEVTVFNDVALLEIGPAFGEAVLFAGLVYPLVFGVAGGFLGFVLGRLLPTVAESSRR